MYVWQLHWGNDEQPWDGVSCSQRNSCAQPNVCFDQLWFGLSSHWVGGVTTRLAGIVECDRLPSWLGYFYVFLIPLYKPMYLYRLEAHCRLHQLFVMVMMVNRKKTAQCDRLFYILFFNLYLIFPFRVFVHRPWFFGPFLRDLTKLELGAMVGVLGGVRFWGNMQMTSTRSSSGLRPKLLRFVTAIRLNCCSDEFVLGRNRYCTSVHFFLSHHPQKIETQFFIDV